MELHVDSFQIISSVLKIFPCKEIFFILFIIFIFIFLFKKIPYFLEKTSLLNSGINEIDKMNGDVFEKYLEVMFKKYNYTVLRTRYRGDYGADVILKKMV